MVYFTMALALFADDDYEEVAARLAGTLQWWGSGVDGWEPPTSGGLTQARQRLGVEPLITVFEQVAVPVAEPLTRGAFLAGWRLMAIDGFEWDAPDTPANAEVFGYAAGSEGRSAFPKVRVVTISECGSHAMIDAAIGERGQAKAGSEQALARLLYPRAEGDWLLIADRNFYNFTDWQAAQASGTQLLWRAKSNLRLPQLRRFGDGSYLSVLINSAIQGKKRRHQIHHAASHGLPLDPSEASVVRVVEYTVPDRAEADKPELIRLITTLTDPADAPAQALAQTYHERWEHEGTIDELTTHQLNRPELRSKTPAGVIQEIEGLLLAHYMVRTLMFEVAQREGVAPRRISFTATLKILRCRLPEVPRSKSGQRRWWEDLLTEIGEAKLEPRRDRINPRVIKRKMSKWLKKRAGHCKPEQPSMPFRDAILIL